MQTYRRRLSPASVPGIKHNGVWLMNYRMNPEKNPLFFSVMLKHFYFKVNLTHPEKTLFFSMKTLSKLIGYPETLLF